MWREAHGNQVTKRPRECETARPRDTEYNTQSDLCNQVTFRYMNLDSILEIMFIFGLEVIQTRRQKLCLQKDMVLYMTS